MSNLPAGYQIDRPLLDEVALLPEIEVAAAALFPPEDLAPELRQAGLSLSFLRESNSEGRLWIARSEEVDAPVGFAVAKLLDASAHLYELSVLPSHGRRGIGRALVLAVAEWAREAGHTSLTLTTFRHLPWNAPFYRGLGFREIRDHCIGPELRAALSEEADHGLDPEKRVAMELEL